MLSRALMAWCLAAVGSAAAWAGADEGVPAPANAPADAQWNAHEGTLALRYHGTVILDATVRACHVDGREVEGVAVRLEPTETLGEKVEQRLVFVPGTSQEGLRLVLRGTVRGSDEAFPAETRSAAQQRFRCVRNSVGLSRSLRNNAIYDRRWDWVLEGPPDGGTHIVLQRREDGGRVFSWRSRGDRIELVFRPRFYQKHRGFAYYKPWTYRVWKGSLTGYCTWWAYREGFTQKTLETMLGIFAEKHLPDFGYTYMQFDNCYQQGNGSCPENWLNWNTKKYPDGWRHAVQAIRDAGMRPGIWVHRIHRPSDPHVKAIAEAHPDWFVHKADGSLFTTHGFYVLDTTSAQAIENMVRKLYRGLKEQGWEYVKIDGTGDLLRAYRNKECDAFFRTHPTTPEQSLRAWDVVAREELGPDVYILACHTVANARYVIGLVDGARLSNDGFQPRTLAQYNSLEGVVWRGDPDHCDILGTWLMDEDARMPVFAMKEPVPARTVIRPALCAMAGAALMVSDKAEVYQDDRNLEGMKRSAPVLFTVPGQLYDCGRTAIPWWLQEIDRPFDHWSVLARFQWAEKTDGKHMKMRGVPEEEIAFADLGLPADREYLVFEFWTQRFLGRSRDSFVAPAMDENTGLQVFAIREARPYPWILSTTRHLSQGGVSLLDVQWDGDAGVLSGRSAVVAGDPYVLTVHVPTGFRLGRARVDGKDAALANQAETATVRVTASATTTVEWTMTFSK